jgi:hypothetical protein
MITSEKLGNLFKALSEFQKEMPILKKDSSVSMELSTGRKIQYDYIDLGSIISQCKNVLSKHGLSIIQPIGTVDNRPVLFTQLSHETGEFIRTYVFLDYEKVTDKGVVLKMKEQDKGSVNTYNSRYCYVGMLRLGIMDEDDDATSLNDSKKVEITKTNKDNKKQQNDDF